MSEHKVGKVLSKKAFAKRVLNYSKLALGLLLFSVGIGILGYHYFAQLNWIDSFYNASMILTGMGPVNEMKTNGAKLFASFYAIFSGVVFLSTVAVFFSPFVHRFMHLFRIEEIEE